MTILRLETLPKLGEVVHVRIDGVQFKNCTGGDAPREIGHAPFSRDAIEKSITTLRSQLHEVPDYQAGYTEWRSHCGGVYKISVAEVVELDDQTFNANLGCAAPRK